jgi:hypothetical protein
MNPIVLLGLGALALLAFAGKKKAVTVSDEGDVTVPEPPPGPTPPPTAEEQSVVDIAIEGYLQNPDGPFSYSLGQEGIDQGVLGIDTDGFVSPVDGESLSGWLTRVSYWGAYQMQGWPLELPPTCLIEATCPADYLPYREALVRLNGEVLSKMAAQGIDDRTF